MAQIDDVLYFSCFSERSKSNKFAVLEVAWNMVLSEF